MEVYYGSLYSGGMLRKFHTSNSDLVLGTLNSKSQVPGNKTSMFLIGLVDLCEFQPQHMYLSSIQKLRTQWLGLVRGTLHRRGTLLSGMAQVTTSVRNWET